MDDASSAPRKREVIGRLDAADVHAPDPTQALARAILPFWSLSGDKSTFRYAKHWTDPGMLTTLGVLFGIADVLCGAAVTVFRRRDLAG